MTLPQLTAGYRRLYAELLADDGIAERIRNKLAHFGTPARLARERPKEAALILWRLLARGIVRGGPGRIWHFLRSLPLSRPRLLPLAVNDWIAGLAMRDYAERHFGLRAGSAPLSPERALARLQRALARWRRLGAVRVELRRPARAAPQIAVRVTGMLDRPLARRLARQVRAVLRRSQARVVLAFESLGGHAELERLTRTLGRHGDRLLIVVGEGLREMLGSEPPLPVAGR
jgi:hypothetical protein